MANTKSAAKRARQGERRRLQNRSVKSNLRSLEKSLRATIPGKQKEETVKSLRSLSSALDKAVKSGVIKKSTANRKKSRLALAANAAK